jgi:hypothetical protein
MRLEVYLGWSDCGWPSPVRSGSISVTPMGPYRFTGIPRRVLNSRDKICIAKAHSVRYIG